MEALLPDVAEEEPWVDDKIHKFGEVATPNLEAPGTVVFMKNSLLSVNLAEKLNMTVILTAVVPPLLLWAHRGTA